MLGGLAANAKFAKKRSAEADKILKSGFIERVLHNWLLLKGAQCV
jgi:hypothetical protein